MKLPVQIIFFLSFCIPMHLLAQEIPDSGETVIGKEETRMFREKQKATALFFEANKAKITDNIDKAILLFTQCTEEDPANDAAWYELSMLYFDQKDIEKSILSAQKAYELAPANTWYSLSLASLYANNNQPDEAIKVYEHLRQADPDNKSYAMDLATIWLQLDKPQEALKIYNELEAKSGINEELSMRKHQIYLATGKDKKALEELEKLADANAYDSRILSMLAEFYMLQGMKEKALLTYEQILKVDPENPYINISLADYYRQQGELQKATAYLKAGFYNPYLDADAKVQIMMTYFSQIKEYAGLEDEINELSGILVEMHPNEPRALILRGELLLMSEKFEEALDLFKKVNMLDPGKYQVWENILRIDAYLENYAQLAQESSTAIDLFPVQPMPYYYNGIAHYLLKNYEKAIQSLTTGVKFIVNNNALSSDFYSMIGDNWHALEKDNETFAAYESALKFNPDNASVLNNYAYYLSIQGKDLEKAEKMAKRANELSPDNATFLDTYAWVFFKQGNYNQALIYIEKALQLNEKSGGVEYEHYGDILFRLNRISDAIIWWKKAQETGEGSTLLESKIKDGKLYE